MPQETEGTNKGGEQAPPWTKLKLKPPATLESLRQDTENDPEGAEEFVELIRALRKEGSRPVSL